MSWDVPPLEAESGWVEVSENGWGALIAWAAGPENLRRTPRSDEGRTVRASCTTGGTTREWTEPFTAEDRRSVDDSINEFLLDAAIPAQPPGYVWFIRVPPHFSSADAFLGAVNAKMNAGDSRPPAELARAACRAMDHFYGRDS